MATGLDRRTEAVLGIVFLAAMVVMIALAITTFEGRPTILLLLAALLFLGVALFFLSGGGRTSGAVADAQSQQQSVVLGDGRTIAQGGSKACPACGARAASGAAYCPACGAAL